MVAKWVVAPKGYLRQTLGTGVRLNIEGHITIFNQKACLTQSPRINQSINQSPRSEDWMSNEYGEKHI